MKFFHEYKLCIERKKRQVTYSIGFEKMEIFLLFVFSADPRCGVESIRNDSDPCLYIHMLYNTQTHGSIKYEKRIKFARRPRFNDALSCFNIANIITNALKNKSVYIQKWTYEVLLTLLNIIILTGNSISTFEILQSRAFELVLRFFSLKKLTCRISFLINENSSKVE